MASQPKTGSKIVCVTSSGPGLDDKIDPAFGRCRYFAIINLDAGTFRAEENHGRKGTGGVGIDAAQTMAKEKVDTLVTERVGPKAAQALNVAGIRVITGASGTVRDAVQQHFGKTI